MTPTIENPAHNKYDGASNIIHLFGQNDVNSKLKAPKKQRVSTLCMKQIRLEALQIAAHLNDIENSDASRWLLRLTSQAYKREVLK